MKLFLAFFDDIPAEALTVLVFLLLSLFQWIKTRFLDKPEEPPEWEDEEMREVIWRRQTGGEPAPPAIPEQAPPPLPGTTIQLDRPTRPNVAPPRKVPQPSPPKLSKRELELANAFEHSTIPSSRRRRTGHRRQVDRMLRSPSAAKNAILLTEILGQPLALREEAGK